ncbi:uncharacterized protein BXZ73DRAFT_100006 [Epithele typhae]|uniref:uncharacterized protein n=1 Tax=Epithele typhae TaxID=378194 RepID=UPI0020077602|nr:uncharacterized protein BXZ73DRAFT_100006 [Epithele typhae]KAH9937790.1 hypothetical protein BXZ73DRAFT_100006 [Epithele typhae]
MAAGSCTTWPFLLQPSALRTKSAPARCTPGTTSRQLGAGLYLVLSYLTHSGNPFGCQIFAPGSTDLKLVATRPTKASDKLTIGLTTSSARSNQEVDYMKGADDQCGNIFDPQLLSDLLSSPILTHLGWSVHVELAFDDKCAVFSPAPADESPLSAVPFTDNKDRYTELPGLLALHSPRLAEFIAPSSEPWPGTATEEGMAICVDRCYPSITCIMERARGRTRRPAPRV